MAGDDRQSGSLRAKDGEIDDPDGVESEDNPTINLGNLTEDQKKALEKLRQDLDRDLAQIEAEFTRSKDARLREYYAEIERIASPKLESSSTNKPEPKT